MAASSESTDRCVESKDGSIELMDGSIELMDGSVELKDRSIELMDGSVELMDGSVELTERCFGSKVPSVSSKLGFLKRPFRTLKGSLDWLPVSTLASFSLHDPFTLMTSICLRIIKESIGVLCHKRFFLLVVLFVAHVTARRCPRFSKRARSRSEGSRRTGRRPAPPTRHSGERREKANALIYESIVPGPDPNAPATAEAPDEELEDDEPEEPLEKVLDDGERMLGRGRAGAEGNRNGYGGAAAAPPYSVTISA